MKLLSRVVALATLCLASSAMAQNIVQNSSFEEGVTNWTFYGMGTGYYGVFAHTGGWVAVTGCVGHNCVAQGQGAFFAQTLNTVSGTSYDLNFWVRESSGATSEMAIYWNGALVADVLNPANAPSSNGWVQYTYSHLAANSNATVLEIHGRQDPGGIYFDDISVTAAVPEPSSYAMLIAGLGALAAVAKRRKA